VSPNEKLQSYTSFYFSKNFGGGCSLTALTNQPSLKITLLDQWHSQHSIRFLESHASHTLINTTENTNWEKRENENHNAKGNQNPVMLGDDINFQYPPSNCTKLHCETHNMESLIPNTLLMYVVYTNAVHKPHLLQGQLNTDFNAANSALSLPISNNRTGKTPK
jgi:hypothetical protein